MVRLRVMTCRTRAVWFFETAKYNRKYQRHEHAGELVPSIMHIQYHQPPPQASPCYIKSHTVLFMYRSRHNSATRKPHVAIVVVVCRRSGNGRAIIRDFMCVCVCCQRKIRELYALIFRARNLSKHFHLNVLLHARSHQSRSDVNTRNNAKHSQSMCTFLEARKSIDILQTFGFAFRNCQPHS